ncbi:MAG: phage tail assembly protein [Alphaproteobacteria bacterium]|nr:phage tail assembly protein [Alphaproteobacteria bacterium]
MEKKNTFKVELETPIKIDGVQVSELNIRRPKVRDLLAVSKQSGSEQEREVNLVANLAEVPIETIQDLDLQDYLKMQEILKGFLSPAMQRK